MRETKERKARPEKDSPDWHRLRIAEQTVKMPAAVAAVMGGPSMEEAQRIVAEYR